jgi:hypothetical protein
MESDSINDSFADLAAGVFKNRGDGNIIQGLSGAHGLVFRVDGAGIVHANGFTTSGADFAESFRVRGAVSGYAPGDVLVIDTASDRRVSLSSSPYSALVSGVYATAPGLVGGKNGTTRTNRAEDGEIPMAVVGVVPTKVTSENGRIKRGDLLVTSSRAGYAMRGTALRIDISKNETSVLEKRIMNETDNRPAVWFIKRQPL